MLDGDPTKDEPTSCLTFAIWFKAVQVVPVTDFRLLIVHVDHHTRSDAAIANGGGPCVPID